MRIIPIAVLALASTVPLAGAGIDDPTGDAARLQGRWTAPAGPDGKGTAILEFQGDRVTMSTRTGDAGARKVLEGRFKVDESAKPHAIDFLGCTGPFGQAQPDTHAIYELDGDRLRIAYPAKAPDDRPTAFPTDDKDPTAPTWTRMKPDADAPK